MLIVDSFTVRTPVDRLWAFLQDVEQIAPCMPGAELTETVDDRTWKGKVHVKFGPVQLTFAGTVVMEEKDDAAHRGKLSAKGTEQRGKGAAIASVESWLEPAAEEGTRVNLRSDITVTGAAAQLSRGLLPDVSKLLTKQFADCLQATLTAEEPAPTTADTAVPGGAPATTPGPAAPARPVPVKGFGLAVRALWSAIKRFFARLLGRRDDS